MYHPASRRRKRSGKILVMLVLLLPVLLGMIGLVIDVGLLLAAQRQTQNAADAAAMAAAMDLLQGQSSGTAKTTGTTFAQTYNGLTTNATVVINIPPNSGPYAGNSQYAEAIVTYPVSTLFIQAVGVNSSQSVQARAVAGFEAVSAGEGVAVLDPNPSGNTGLSVSGSNSVLLVNGRVIVNATDSSAAATVSNGATLKANIIDVVGGVNNPANFQPYTTGDPSPLHTNQLSSPDPLINLSTPTTSNGTVNNGTFTVITNGTPSTLSSGSSVSVTNGQTVTLNPGIYSGIAIKGGTVTFNPGIYVLQPSKTTTNILDITGGTVTGNNVMFYNTGSDYNPTTGLPDSSDGNNSPNAPGSTKFGAIQINSATVNLQPISGGPFDGMLFYQRRWNTQTAKITGSSGDLALGGTLYAKWAQFAISGGGTYQAQFIVGSMSVSGGATITINYAGSRLGKANQVYLVE